MILEPPKIKSDTVSTVSLKKHKLESRLPGGISITSEYADDTTLMKVKEENEKVGLMLNIQKNNIMVSGPITSWQIDGETVDAAYQAPPSMGFSRQEYWSGVPLPSPKKNELLKCPLNRDGLV